MKRVLASLLILTVVMLLLAQIIKKSPTKINNNSIQQTVVANPINLARNFNTPWAITFLPSQDMLLTERTGNVRLLLKEGTLKDDPVLINDKSKDIGEGGLLGIAVHPNFNVNPYVYIYYTYTGDNINSLNRLSRYKYVNETLQDEKILIDRIPGSTYHDGGRIKFGPDGYLYITTGDAENPSQAQDKKSLAGKILRIKDDGTIPSDNPFGNLVYSYGHRNPQGITWDDQGKLWETEHGPSGGSLGTGNDEVNLIVKGDNYGWPVIQGGQRKEGMIAPVINSTPSVTWAPADIAYVDGSLFFGGLKGTALYEYNINNKKLTEHFKNNYGRIREVILGPDNMLYITTSNRDGRGFPISGDDRVIKIDPNSLK